jgi:hypothetical protein
MFKQFKQHSMNSLGKTKFKKLNPRAGYLAPYIQLPWGYREDLIGRAVDIYECEGGYFIKLDGEEFKHAAPEDVMTRLSKLEAEVSDIKNLVNKEDTPGRIRTAVAGSKVLHD